VRVGSRSSTAGATGASSSTTDAARGRGAGRPARALEHRSCREGLQRGPDAEETSEVSVRVGRDERSAGSASVALRMRCSSSAARSASSSTGSGTSAEVVRRALDEAHRDAFAAQREVLDEVRGTASAIPVRVDRSPVPACARQRRTVERVESATAERQRVEHRGRVARPGRAPVVHQRPHEARGRAARSVRSRAHDRRVDAADLRPRRRARAAAADARRSSDP
jgi:hypothetical protein